MKNGKWVKVIAEVKGFIYGENLNVVTEFKDKVRVWTTENDYMGNSMKCQKDIDIDCVEFI